MKRSILRSVSIIILAVFTLTAFLQPSFSYAEVKTGSIKVFSEVKGIEVFVDEKPYGKDAVEINGLTPGQHYVKVMYNNASIYSELVTVNPGASSAILIKSTGETQKSILNSMYSQQQEFKAKKLDILLSTSKQTVGTATTTYNNFPGYFSFMDYATTTSQATEYETTDWKIIQGGVQQISDAQFANLVGDKSTQERIAKDWDDYNNVMTWGAVIGLTGLLMVLAGGAVAFSGSSAADAGAVVFAVGVVPTIVGLGMLSKEPYSGHYVSPSTAAKQAFDYNQNLKKQLGLPESYEPGQ